MRSAGVMAGEYPDPWSIKLFDGLSYVLIEKPVTGYVDLGLVKMLEIRRDMDVFAG